MKKIVLLLLISFNLTAFAANFRVTSAPEGADVFIKRKSDDTAAKIGVTPIGTTLEEVRAKYGLGETFYIEVKKEGHESYNIMMAPIASSDIELAVKLPVSRDIMLTRKFDNIAFQLFEAQRLTRDKNFESALKVLDAIEKEEKYLSVINEMRGGVYYLKKDFNSALSYYRRAFAINSENKDAYSMKLYLEKALGLNKDE